MQATKATRIDENGACVGVFDVDAKIEQLVMQAEELHKQSLQSLMPQADFDDPDACHAQALGGTKAASSTGGSAFFKP